MAFAIIFQNLYALNIMYLYKNITLIYFYFQAENNKSDEKEIEKISEEEKLEAVEKVDSKKSMYFEELF